MKVTEKSLVRRTGMSVVAFAVAGFTMAALSGCGGSSHGGGGGGDPTPRPTVNANLCATLGNGVQTASCGRTTTQLASQVDTAIDKLITDQPGLFNKTEELNPGQRDYLIVDANNFLKGVAANLNAAGLCAETDLFNDHRVKVKSSSNSSEAYNITSIDYGGGSYVQRSPTSYDLSCTPAAFPLDRNPDVPPPDQKCGQPYPPEINDLGVRVFLKAGGIWTLDATPRIADNRAYCATWFTDPGRSTCPVRPEGIEDKVFCEGWRVGRASDTGLLGPTWTRDGKPCTGPASGCANSPQNQFQLLVYEGDGAYHRYEACTDQGFCGSTEVNR